MEQPPELVLWHFIWFAIAISGVSKQPKRIHELYNCNWSAIDCTEQLFRLHCKPGKIFDFLKQAGNTKLHSVHKPPGKLCCTLPEQTFARYSAHQWTPHSVWRSDTACTFLLQIITCAPIHGAWSCELTLRWTMVLVVDNFVQKVSKPHQIRSQIISQQTIRKISEKLNFMSIQVFKCWKT